MRRAAAFLAVMACAPIARADPENALGLGPEAAARASAVSALTLGVPSVHYDPAALALRPDGTTDVSLSFVWAQPLLFAESLDAGGSPELPDSPDGTAAVFAGTRFDLGSAIGIPGLHAAFALYSPLAHVFLYETHPDDHPQWLMWGDRTQHIEVWLGLGYRVTDWLSLGVSMRLLFDVELLTTGRVRGVHTTPDPGGEDVVAADTELGEELRVVGHAAPILGAAITPSPGIRAALVWRGATRLDDWGWARVAGETGGLGALGYVYRFSHYYRPHEIALSGAWEPTPGLSVTAELTWQMWSRAVGGTFEHLPGRYGDTLVPAVSGRLDVAHGIAMMAGYRYVRAPFDNFGGPTNLLDNDRHEPSAGMSFAFDDVPLVLSWGFRLAVLETREERKDWQRFRSDGDLRNNPGYPGYRHGGVVPSAQIGVDASW